MDEAGARMRIRNMTLPKELRDLDEKLRKIRAEKDRAIGDQNFERAAELRDEEASVKAKRAEAEVEMRRMEAELRSKLLEVR